MGARGEAYAGQLRAASDDFARLIERTSDAAWRATCEPEHWSRAATAHHIAVSTGQVAGLVQMAAAGRDLPPLTPDMLNEMNAQHARDFAGCSKEDTLALLATNTATAEQVLRGLDDAQIDRTVTLIQPMPLQTVIEVILIGHIGQHPASIAAAGAD